MRGILREMKLEQDACYRALAARDRRFDGRFFTGVKTTGIFCRPVCPARTPKRENVEFFVSAAAAHGAGYRPCLVCRPEVAPASAAWQGTEAVVGRALRLIEEGGLDEDTLEELAGRLGIGERQLRRLFQEHVGASPLEVALTRRVLQAKSLITGSSLTLAEAAFASGFQSIRRFNDAFRKYYRVSPSELRRKSTRPKEDRLTLLLPVALPYRWDLFTAFVEPRLIPQVESLEGNTYRRRLPEGEMEAEYRERDGLIQLRLPLGAVSRLRELTEAARRFFDTRANPVAIADALRAEIEIPCGLRIPGAWDPFEVTVRAVLGQQVSVKAGTALAARLVERLGGDLTAAGMARADLTGVGLSQRQQETLKAVAAAVLEGRVDWSAPKTLQELRGIGPWTVNYVAMRTGDPDAFPQGDLYLKAYGNGERFRPWRAYAAMAIWMKAEVKQ